MRNRSGVGVINTRVPHFGVDPCGALREYGRGLKSRGLTTLAQVREKKSFFLSNSLLARMIDVGCYCEWSVMTEPVRRAKGEYAGSTNHASSCEEYIAMQMMMVVEEGCVPE